MKRRYIIFVFFVIIITLGFVVRFLFLEVDDRSIEIFKEKGVPEYSQCNSSLDCVSVSDVCSCGNGGKNISVNYRFKDDYYDVLTGGKGMVCITALGDVDSCKKVARCINNKCVLKESFNPFRKARW